MKIKHNAALNLKIAVGIVGFLTEPRRSVPIDEAGTLEFRPAGDGVRHCVARLRAPDGESATFVIGVTVGSAAPNDEEG